MEYAWFTQAVIGEHNANKTITNHQRNAKKARVQKIYTHEWICYI